MVNKKIIIGVIGTVSLLGLILVLQGPTFFKRFATKSVPKSLQGPTFLPTFGSSAVLGSSTNPVTLDINIPTFFNDVVTFNKDIIAPNVVYSINGGVGIGTRSESGVTTITNTGVTSLGGSTGALSLTSGSGISIDGLKVTNSDLGSSQNIFKNIAVTNLTDVITAGANSDTLTFTPGLGLTITPDTTNKKLTLTPNSSDINISGWTHSTGTIYTNNLVGINATPSANSLEVGGTGYITGALTLGGDLTVNGLSALRGNLNVNGNTILGDTTLDSLTFNAKLANGSTIAPVNDLGADLGTENLRFNNLYVANLNSNTGFTSKGQAIFTYAPIATGYTAGSVIVNPTVPVANGQLLGIGINSYQKAGIDAEGDLTLGYLGNTSIPTSTNPLAIYNHGSTEVAHIDTTGNFVSSGSLDINGLTSDIAGALNLSGNSLTSTGALTITPTAGNNLNLAVSGNGDFAVNTNKLVVDGNTGFVGIGTTSPTSALDVAVASGTDGIRLTNSLTNTKALGLSFGTNVAGIDVFSADPTNLLTNGSFTTDLTGWTGTQTYTLQDEFSDTLPATLYSGAISNPSPSLGSELLTNGGFDADTDWTKAAGWTIGGGTANHAGSSDIIQPSVNPI